MSSKLISDTDELSKLEDDELEVEELELEELELELEVEELEVDELEVEELEAVCNTTVLGHIGDFTFIRFMIPSSRFNLPPSISSISSSILPTNALTNPSCDANGEYATKAALVTFSP